MGYPVPPLGQARPLQAYVDFIMKLTADAVYESELEVVGNMVYRTLADSTEGYTQTTVTVFDDLDEDSNKNMAIHAGIMQFMSGPPRNDLAA